MADFDFSTYILNVPEDSIESFSTCKSGNVLHIVVRLKPVRIVVVLPKSKDIPVIHTTTLMSLVSLLSSTGSADVTYAKTVENHFLRSALSVLRISISPTLFSETSLLHCIMFV